MTSRADTKGGKANGSQDTHRGRLQATNPRRPAGASPELLQGVQAQGIQGDEERREPRGSSGHGSLGHRRRSGNPNPMRDVGRGSLESRQTAGNLEVGERLDTQKHIADAIKVPQKTVSNWLHMANGRNGDVAKADSYSQITEGISSHIPPRPITLFPCWYEDTAYYGSYDS